jgi:methylmalonyl-CoA mutase C-terminal domain/subunit
MEGKGSGQKRIRILLTKSRIDGHDRGVRYVAKELRDAGMEVIFTRYRLPEEIVMTAIQEAVDVIGVSCSTGGHLYVAERIQQEFTKVGGEEIKVIFGGIIPDLDIPKMKKKGVAAIFGPGSSIEEIIQTIVEPSKPLKSAT